MTTPTHLPEDTFKHFAAWLAALFLVVLGAKLWVVQLYGSPLPLWDQWYEADNFFRPWVEGQLTWRDFFAPHNEHRIFFTRLLDLGLIRLNGRWEPLLQMTVNAFIYAIFACGVAWVLWRFWERKNGGFICFLLAPFFALPYAAENTIWAINSQTYFLNVFSLATLIGLGFGRPGGRGWWFGLAAGILGLFSAAAGLLAAVATGGLIVLRAIKSRRMDRGALITLGLCLAITGLGAALSVKVEADQPLQAHTLAEFASALFHNLAWPFFDVPEMMILIFAPLVLLLALYFRPGFQSSQAAELLLGLGLWSGLQSAALAYGRANYGDGIPASRYMDELTFLVIASLFAAVLLVQSWSRGRFPEGIALLMSLAFAAVLFSGLCRISQIVVDNLLAPTRMTTLVAEERTEAFLATGDPRELLERPTVRPDPQLTLRLLRNARLQTILPVECLPAAMPRVTGRLAAVSQALLRHAMTVLFCGLIWFTGLYGYGLVRATLGLARENPAGIAVLLTCLVTCLVAFGFFWSKRSVSRESVEYQMHRDLAAYFKSSNNLKRAAIHEHKADELGKSGNLSHAAQ